MYAAYRSTTCICQEKTCAYVSKHNQAKEKAKKLRLGVNRVCQEIIVMREKISMAKGKPQQTGMTAEINSIPTCAI